MPASVRWAVGCVWLHAVFSGLSGLMMLAAFNRQQGDAGAVVRFLSMASVLVGLLLGTCAGLAPRGAGWTWTTVISIEALFALPCAGLVLTGVAFPLPGIALASFVLWVFLSADGREWFSQEQTAGDRGRHR